MHVSPRHRAQVLLSCPPPLLGHYLAEVRSTCRVCPRWAGVQQARLCPALSLSLAGRQPGWARCRGEVRPGVLAPPQPLGASVPRDLTGSGKRRERQPCPVTTPRQVPVPEAHAPPGPQVACGAREGRQGSRAKLAGHSVWPSSQRDCLPGE